MSQEPRRVLEDVFGFPSFRDGQEQVITALLEGQSVAAVFPTGAGKSLCYQLPALVLDGLTLVVSPLMALMKDQVDTLKARGIAAERLDSSLSAEEYREVLQRARAGDLKLLYVAPERFNNERFRQSVRSFSVSLMAIDEAHCVSEWGHNFRPDYLKLAKYAQFCGAERVLALTATATPKVLLDVSERFSLDLCVRTPFHRANLHLGASCLASEKAKFRALQEALNKDPKGPTIVYVSLQRSAEDLAESLAQMGLEARAYHAGLDSELREQTQEWFLASETGIVVATIAFGMGIDKANIRRVYHFDPPKSLENYSQEIGRAGRDGELSQCRFFYHPPDRIPLENFVYGDTPNQSAIRSLLEELFQGERELVLNLNGLSRAHDIRMLVLKTMLTYLELDGYLEALTPVYASYRFKPSAASKEILNHYQGAERELMIKTLGQAQKKRVWFQIDLAEAAAQIGRQRGEVVGVLDKLALDGWMELQASNLRFRYRVLNLDPDLENLANELFEQACQREKAEISRLQQVLELPTQDKCLARRLASHFGEDLGQDCGHCSVCLGERREPVDVPTGVFELPELPNELADIRTKARFLCGIRSPLLTRLKLTKHPEFGALSGLSFARVMEKLEWESSCQPRR